MYCKYCGREIPDDENFCPYCGKPVNTEDTTEETENVRGGNREPHPKFPVWIIVVVVALVIGIAGFLIGRSSSDSKSEAAVKETEEATEEPAETEEPTAAATATPVTEDTDLMLSFRNTAQAQSSGNWYGMKIDMPEKNLFHTDQNSYLNGLRRHVNVDQFFGDHISLATDSDYINFNSGSKGGTDMTATIIKFDSDQNARDWYNNMYDWLSSCRQKQVTTDGKTDCTITMNNTLDSGEGFWYQETKDKTGNAYYDLYSIKDSYVMLESSYVNIGTTNLDDMQNKMSSFRQSVGFTQ